MWAIRPTELLRLDLDGLRAFVGAEYVLPVTTLEARELADAARLLDATRDEAARIVCRWCGENMPTQTYEVHEVLIHPDMRMKAS